MTKKPKEMTIDGIKEIIKQSGYLTEINVARALRNDGWWVFSQSPYVDTTEKKVKLIDMLSIKPVTSKLTASLIIECKKSTKHGWAFHTISKMGGLQSAFAFIFDFIIKFKGVPRAGAQITQKLLLQKGISLDGCHLSRTETRIGTLCCIPLKHPDDFHQGSHQLLNGLKSIRKRMKNQVCFPVIVFDGPMWEFYYDENGELEVKDINYLQYLSVISEDGETSICLIDVVKSSYFTEFLKLIDGSIEWLKNVLR